MLCFAGRLHNRGNKAKCSYLKYLCLALETTDGFQCPSSAPTDEFGQFDPHPKYADPNDCANFYVCLNGISPREQGCELGLVFNELTNQCDAPENVPEW